MYPNCTSDLSLAYALSSNPSEEIDTPIILEWGINTIRKDCYPVNRPDRAGYIHVWPLQKGEKYTFKLKITTKQHIRKSVETKIRLSTDEQFNIGPTTPFITMNYKKCCK